MRPETSSQRLILKAKQEAQRHCDISPTLTIESFEGQIKQRFNFISTFVLEKSI